MKKLALFAVTLALVLPLAGRPAGAATQVTAIAQATGDKDPFVVAWIDDANGNTKTDSAESSKIHDAFAGIQYIITDQGDLLLGQVSGGKFSPLLPSGHAIDVNNGKGYYVVHLRSQTTFLDGTVIRFSTKPEQGLASLVLTLQDGKGGSASIYIEQLLTWASAQPAPTPPAPTPNPFGF